MNQAIEMMILIAATITIPVSSAAGLMPGGQQEPGQREVQPRGVRAEQPIFHRAQEQDARARCRGWSARRRRACQVREPKNRDSPAATGAAAGR